MEQYYRKKVRNISVSGISMPNDNNFLSNKNISDRLYAYIMLIGLRKNGGIYIDKPPRNIYKELGIDYRTFHKRMQELENCGYLEDCDYLYRVATENNDFNRLIYEDTLWLLYNTGIDNIIKVYNHLGALYDTYKGRAYFSYNTILNAIGYNYSRNISNKEKIKQILDKLVELGLLEYEAIGNSNIRESRKYKITNIRKGEVKND